MAMTINSNAPAASAARFLSNDTSNISSSMSRLSTGLKLSTGKDDPAGSTVSNVLRQTSSSLTIENQSLASAKGAVDVGVAATDQVAGALKNIRQVVTQLTDTSLDSSKRTELQAQFKNLVSEIGKAIDSASVNGLNTLSGDKQNVTANARGDTIEFGGADLKAKLALPTEMNSAAAAQTFLGQTSSVSSPGANQAGGVKLADLESAVSNTMNELGASSRRIGAQISFNNAMQESMNTSLGAIVDADLSMESANLQAMQVKQQLGAQPLSIANQAPQSLLSLFR